MNRLRLFTLVFLFAITYVDAQQLNLFTQYREQAEMLNPAAISANYLAYEQNVSFLASYRKQWTDLEAGPVTQVVNGSFLYNGRGVSFLTGGHLVNDVTGPTAFTGLYGRIGGVISADPYFGGVSVAISGGAVQYRLNGNEIRLREAGDVLANQSYSQLYPDLGVGIFAYQRITSGREDLIIYGGISVPQLIGLDLTFKSDNGDFYVQRIQHYYAMLGLYKFFRNDGFIEPSVWIKYAQNAPLNLDFNLKLQVAPNFYVGVGGSTAQAIHLETGFVLGGLGYDNTFRVGYGFDYSFTSFGPYAGTTHEINVTYSFEH